VAAVTLRALAGVTLATNAAGAAVSIAKGMPAEWGRGVLGSLAVIGNPKHVHRDFLTWKGTAIAPPLPMLVALVALAGAEARRSSTSARAIAALGTAGTLGHLGEPFTWRALRGRGPFAPAALGLASLALYATMAVGGAIEARRRA
jgi:hypothetical protein